MEFETLTGLCCHIKPKHLVLSSVYQGPPLAWVAYRHLHLQEWKKEHSSLQAAGPSMAANPQVNWAETN